MKPPYTVNRLLVIARACAVQKEKTLFFQNLDGAYLDGIANGFSKMTVLAAIHRRELDETYTTFGNYTFQFKSRNIEIVEIPDYKNYRYTPLNALARLPKQFWIILQQVRRHDVVFVMMSTYRGVFAALISKLLGKRIVVYSGNDWKMDIDSTFKWNGAIGQALFNPYKAACGTAEKLAMRCADLRLLNGASLMERYEKYKGMTVQTHPIINIKPQDLYEREDTCQGDTIRLLCVASVQKRKGIEYLIQAMAKLLQRNPNAHLRIVGALSHPYGDEMVDLCHRLNLQDHVHFAGYVAKLTELLAFYRNSDLFVLPSLSEGFPRVIFEAMSQSLPVITTQITNIYNRLGDCGLVHYSSPASAEELANAILSVLNDGGKRKGLIRNSYQYVSSIIRHNAADQFLAAWRDLSNNKSKPAIA
jgi:glycosyltransferase involved in cell wall biosynthesis